LKVRSISQLKEAVLEQRELEKKAASTGFTDLDKCIGGFLPRHLYTLTGHTNTGKTTLACNFADNVRKQGKKVLYIALEPDINIVLSLASVRLNKAYKDLTESDIGYDDGLIEILLQEDVKNLKELVQIISEQSLKYNLIIVDHIGYFLSGENVIQAQADALKILAKITKDYKTAVLIIAHPRKIPTHKLIFMEDIGGSASFMQDSTEVIILHRFLKEPNNELNREYDFKATITVPKTKKANGYSYCEVYFQSQKAKILSSNEVYKDKIYD